MAPGHEFCMYCEYDHGSAIEHFAPMEKYPTSAFAWDNYLLSCSDCNSKYKGTQFPLDERGLPLLVNPTREEPREHIEFSPRSGKLSGCTPKGNTTIDVLGFDRRGNLDKTRLFAWRSVQRCLVSYDEACTEGNWVRALEVQRDLCQHPHASLLSLLIEVLGKPGGALLVAERRCGPILAAYPEIGTWI
ncbi:MAG: HNH endonuclease [Byssovorax sp.]